MTSLVSSEGSDAFIVSRLLYSDHTIIYWIMFILAFITNGVSLY